MINKILYFLGVLCMICSVLPYVIHGVSNIGIYVLFVAGVYCFIVPYFRIKFNTAILSITAIAMSIFFAMSLAMIYIGYFNLPVENKDYTMIILGAQTKNGKPSTMLKNRLDKGIEYRLQNNFEGDIIVCGKSPESDIMKNYLVQNGVTEDQVILENLSTDTEENIYYASKIIEENTLSQDVIIVTDGFHQLRSYIIGNDKGLNVKNISSATPFLIMPSFWVRDMGGAVLEIFS